MGHRPNYHYFYSHAKSLYTESMKQPQIIFFYEDLHIFHQVKKLNRQESWNVEGPGDPRAVLETRLHLNSRAVDTAPSRGSRHSGQTIDT